MNDSFSDRLDEGSIVEQEGKYSHYNDVCTNQCIKLTTWDHVFKVNGEIKQHWFYKLEEHRK